MSRPRKLEWMTLPDPATGDPALLRRRLWVSGTGDVSDARWTPGEHLATRRETSGAPPSIVFMFEGSCVRQYRDDRISVGDRMHVSLYNLDEDTWVRHPDPRPTEGLTIRLDPDLIRAFLAERGDFMERDAAQPFPVSSIPVPGWLALRARLCRDTLAGEASVDPLEVEDALLGIVRDVVALAFRHAPEPRRPVAGSRLRDRVVELQYRLSQGAPDRVRLESLAAEAGCSSWHLSKAFPEVCGETLSRFLCRVRAHEALRHVLDGAADLSQVALETGFATHSHLTAAFRREFGMPPSAIRDADRLSLARRLDGGRPS